MKDTEPKGPESNMEYSPINVMKHHGDVSPAGVSTVPSTNPSGGESDIQNPLISSDYHLTVKIVNSQLTRRQISLLLGVLCYQAVHYGVNFGMYLSLLHLNEILLGNKIKASEVKDKYERLSVLLSQVIIRDLAGKDLSLTENRRLSEKTTNLLLNSRGLMTRDTYKSRFNHWRPERFLSIRTVPVDVIIERNGNSVRYSSYCKGYGEGTGTARRGKTPPSFELDGEETTEWTLGSQDLTLQEFSQNVFLIAHFEWLKRFRDED